MDWVVELELMIGDDFTGTAILVGKDTILQSDDRVGGAHGFGLGGNGCGCADIVGSYLEGARVVLVTTIGSLR